MLHCVTRLPAMAQRSLLTGTSLSQVSFSLVPFPLDDRVDEDGTKKALEPIHCSPRILPTVESGDESHRMKTRFLSIQVYSGFRSAKDTHCSLPSSIMSPLSRAAHIPGNHVLQQVEEVQLARSRVSQPRSSLSRRPHSHTIPCTPSYRPGQPPSFQSPRPAKQPLSSGRKFSLVELRTLASSRPHLAVTRESSLRIWRAEKSTDLVPTLQFPPFREYRSGSYRSNTANPFLPTFSPPTRRRGRRVATTWSAVRPVDRCVRREDEARGEEGGERTESREGETMPAFSQAWPSCSQCTVSSVHAGCTRLAWRAQGGTASEGGGIVVCVIPLLEGKTLQQAADVRGATRSALAV